MAHPFPLASVFTAGMRRDVDRTMLPGGAVWNLVDFIPDEIQAAASGRGGWTYLTTSAIGSGTKALAVGIWDPANSDRKIVAVNDVPSAYNVTSGTPSAIGGSIVRKGGAPPLFHRGKLIITDDGGTQTPSYYDGSTIGYLSAPTAMRLAVFKDHTVLANATGNTNRVWFSAAGDPTTWDTSFGWWDTTGDVTALASTLNALLVFHGDSVERLRGTTPPPGSDMVLEPFFNDGCLDPFSVAYWGQRVIWASSRGIYLTDGASVVDLTAAAGMKTYWNSLFTGFTSAWRVSGGIYRDHYIVTINDGSTLVDCLCVSLLNRTIWRFTNLHGSSFVNITAGLQEKTYMGLWNASRVVELSSIWSPSASVKQDGDGTNPAPIIETGAFRGYDRLHRRWIQSMGLQKWRWIYTDYDLRDSASDNPTISLSYAPDLSSSYTAVTGGTLPATTKYTRKRRSLNTTQGGASRSDNLALKLAVTGPYATCNLYTLEGDWSPIDIGRLA